jgi:hypothetical protein
MEMFVFDKDMSVSGPRLEKNISVIVELIFFFLLDIHVEDGDIILMKKRVAIDENSAPDYSQR